MFTLLTEANLTASAAKQAGLWLPDLPGATAQRLIHDALVAAVALERGEVVYTRNRRDLGRFPVKIEGY